jgi:hypothetical protein
LRRSTIMTATFAALRNLSCTEARQGLCELRRVSNPGEVAARSESKPVRLLEVVHLEVGSAPRSPARMRTMTALRQFGRTSLHREAISSIT